ncbi:MAG: HD domain-containing protein [Desulforhabdus sp.]|jgi:putative hydrolase of HD superfamily|nr:HD domain-containing protein [Desulforhabdus sp.]
MKMDATGYRSNLQEQGASSYRNIANFFFELGMLKKTPRSGFQFLGSGRESVADHSFRVTMIGYTLAQLIHYSDPFRVVCLCLFHDIPEARIGDLNYVNKQYVKADEKGAISDLAESLPFGADFKAALEEYRQGETLPARLAHDADQLDLILELKEQSDLGNNYAPQWIHFALKRLKTEIAKEVAAEVLQTDSSSWWFDGHDHWWHPDQER